VTTTTVDKNHADRIRQLTAARQAIFAQPGFQAMEAILDHPQPAALVHSFPEADLHVLIHDIGPANALPILALASNRQWEYFLDMETWRGDRLDYQHTTAWLGLLLQADPDRLARWCFEDKLDLIELFLFRNIELRIRETDEAPSDFGEGFFTDDDTFYVRCIDYPVATPQEEAAKTRRNEMIAQLLRRLSLLDHVRYQGLLMEAAGVIPAEAEESLYRLRNVRLGEKGLLPYEAAIGIYQPLKAGDLDARGRKIFLTPSREDERLPVPHFASSILEGDLLFVRALKHITQSHVLEQLQIEFAGVCNQVITADQVVVRDRQLLRSVTGKVAGYLSIGLEQLIGEAPPEPEHAAIDRLRHHLLTDIFKTGYARALQLKWRAHRWHKQSWCQAQGVGLTFWDEAWLGLLGGLLIERPMLYDRRRSDSHYRDFETLRELEAAGRELDRVMALDRLFQSMNVDLQSMADNRFLTFKNLLLTLWARSCLDLPPMDPATTGIAIPLPAFKAFYEKLWTGQGGDRTIRDARKTDFLQWTAAATGDAAMTLSDRLGVVFELLFTELEDELAAVASGNLDPHHVNLFLLTP
jgi:hypothetical protein